MTTEAPAPDHPKVTRPRWAKSVIALALLGTFVVGAYGLTAFTGYEPFTPERDEVPASVRSSPGGYRTYHFWHSGYHGGK